MISKFTETFLQTLAARGLHVASIVKYTYKDRYFHTTALSK